jgi:Protein NO VEIN, C-terminal/Domain of unknown function (DUF3427)
LSKLLPYTDYSRSEVHEIFAPDTDFTPQAGTWGLQGIVQIPGRDGDFVFFVTFGQRQANHIFDEGVTTDGVLTWQSQPKQKLSDRQIQQFINHNEDVNSIYLFLRTSPQKKYTYLGKLKYLAHDKEREQPVYFQWQILDWNIPESVLKDISLTLEVVSPTPPPSTSPNGPGLVKTAPPEIAPTAIGTPLETKLFRARKVDYTRQSARDKRVGRAGELLVLDYERQALRNAGIPELAEKVRHVADVEGDGAGYDIESYDPDGTRKYIEVKTTTGNQSGEFYVTANELQFSRQHSDKFYLYRVYHYDEVNNRAKFFTVKGSLENNFALFPVQFRVKLGPQR